VKWVSAGRNSSQGDPLAIGRKEQGRKEKIGKKSARDGPRMQKRIYPGDGNNQKCLENSKQRGGERHQKYGK